MLVTTSFCFFNRKKQFLGQKAAKSKTRPMKLDISRRKAWEPFQDHSHITTELVFTPIPILHDLLNSNSYQHYCWYMDVP